MLSEFQTEIVAGVSIVVIIIVYLVIRKGKSNGVETKEEIQRELETIQPKIKPQEVEHEETPVESTIIEDAYDDLSGSEEGDFGEEEDELPSEKQRNKKTIQKRDVPLHGKITKQNFSEFSGRRILVAEDNLINQKVLTGLLADSGIELVIANDGQEALDILENDDDFLMILMDAHMPRVDGFEATRIIRSNPKYDHILVVALSGDTAADDIAKMSAAGMAEHLEKPLRMEALYEILYAYTGDTQTKNSDDYVEVIMTKELNGDKGLSICGGDEAFYHEILDEFISTYENSTHELGDLLQNDSLEKADKLLLDIIGVTANIGAEPLNKIANEIKLTLSDTKEKSYLTLVDQYKMHLDNLIKDIKEYKDISS